MISYIKFYINNCFFLLLTFLISLFKTFSQKNIDSLISFPMVSANYMVQLPLADMSKNYGINNNIGTSLIYKTKNNVFFEINYNFIFGNKLKGDALKIFDSITTSDGNIINEHGEYAKVITSERGYFVGLKIGLNTFKIKNPNSGILFKLGFGLFQHKINIENDGNNAPQILGEYKYGYDKMRYGPCFSQAIAFIYFSKSQIINFCLGIEFYEAFTKSGRAYDFNLRKKDNNNYLDILSSIMFSWIIPFYKKSANETYYY